MAERFLRRRDVEEMVGYSRSVIYDKMSRGEFPRPVRTGPKAVRWIESEIVEWQQSRIQARAAA